MKIETKRLLDIQDAVDKLYKRNYSNARQTAQVARVLNQARRVRDEFVEVKDKYLAEHAPDGARILKETHPDEHAAAKEYMTTLLEHEQEIDTKQILSYDDLDKNKKDAFTAEEIDALIILEMLVQSANED